MGVAPVIVVDKGEQPGLEVRHRTEVTLLQESPCKHAEPQFHLVEP